TEAGNVASGTLVWQTISAQLGAFGWVQKADTGQVNLNGALVYAKYDVGYSVGYQIWGLGDALQATSPFYMRVDFGTVSQVAVGIWVTFGTSTDGAGTIGGQKSSLMAVASAGEYTTLQNCYFSGATNRFGFNLFDGPTQYDNVMLSVERTKSAAGVDTGDGLVIATRGSYTLTVSQVITTAAVGPIGDAQPYFLAALNIQQNSMATQAKVGFAYIVPFNGIPFNPGLGLLLYQTSDFPQYTVQSLAMYDGLNHNYLVCTPNSLSPCFGIANVHMLLRYE
ncbi:MAG: hypothetical protein ACREQ5_32250, partial [Candidatus Dormibacteria bacterium]